MTYKSTADIIYSFNNSCFVSDGGESLKQFDEITQIRFECKVLRG